ncbi:VTT domain-containing protein [Georgenia sp. 10Sc9-8]|uniref:VTT domain-containing protein n=1 Tax=Georgenia halotolerans TaxID=3028317 RepID=A0ABT5U1R6_9MICO|nr:VTT domain-containing protein [Georgenia halotolerans]
MELMAAVEGFVLDLGATPWILVAVAVLSMIDGFFPPVPSESVVIAVAVLAVTGEGPSLWLLVAAAAVGAFCGDLIAFTIGQHVPVHRMRLFSTGRGRAALDWASRALERRGTVFILSARFVPIGRVAVNMTAGAVGFPRLRFVVVAAIAGLVWAGYSTVLGVGAGHVMHEHPLVAIAIGVVGGVLLGFLVEAVLRRVGARWVRPLDRAAAGAGGALAGDDEGPADRRI